eukprot:6173910-Pleurochrysis_carterae.AAC.2
MMPLDVVQLKPFLWSTRRRAAAALPALPRGSDARAGMLAPLYVLCCATLTWARLRKFTPSFGESRNLAASRWPCDTSSPSSAWLKLLRACTCVIRCAKRRLYTRRTQRLSHAFRQHCLYRPHIFLLRCLCCVQLRSSSLHNATAHVEHLALHFQVRQDDVDLAISVMLRSVINSQKYAVKRSMEIKFSKYLVSGQDANQLIEFQLRRLFGQAAELNALRRATLPVAVLLEDFESRAKEVAVDDLSQFYKSDSFLGDGVARIGFRRTRNASGAEVLVRASDLQTYNNAVAAETAA